MSICGFTLKNLARKQCGRGFLSSRGERESKDTPLDFVGNWDQRLSKNIAVLMTAGPSLHTGNMCFRTNVDIRQTCPLLDAVS